MRQSQYKDFSLCFLLSSLPEWAFLQHV